MSVSMIILRKIVYIKVYRGYLIARTIGQNNEQRFNCNGMTHPRTLVGELPEIKETFRACIQEQPNSLFGLMRPKVIIHLLVQAEGGYTEEERRALWEAAKFGGGIDPFLISNCNQPLSDEDVRSLMFGSLD